MTTTAAAWLGGRTNWRPSYQVQWLKAKTRAARAQHDPILSYPILSVLLLGALTLLVLDTADNTKGIALVWSLCRGVGVQKSWPF